MISLIVGASASGKSEFAEKKALERFRHLQNSVSSITGGVKRYAFDGDLVYLATMINSDAETNERIDRHVIRRQGMGFETLEVPYDLGNIAENKLRRNSVVLLECLSNLLSNEMFLHPETGSGSEESAADKVFKDLKALKAMCHDLIIVSNNVFEDGVAYEGGTALYIKYLGELHRNLSAVCDEVYEVVVGIPIKQKYGVPARKGTVNSMRNRLNGLD